MSNNKKPNISDWFWAIIHECRPSLKLLEARLEELPKELLENYLVCYEIASTCICDPWNGPYINKDIGNLSEDGTEDLASWIVSQGKELWEAAYSRKIDLRDLFYMSEGMISMIDYDITEWSAEVSKENHRGWQSPDGIGKIIYEERFDVNYYDVQEELMGIYESKY